MRFALCLALCAMVCPEAFCAGDPPAAGVDPGGPGSLPASPGDVASGEGGHYAHVHGLKMYYEIHGTGPALLVLHGGMGSIPVYAQNIEYFSREYRVIAPEQMGHGRTADDPSRPMDYHAMAEDTAELLRQLGIGRAFVLGHSDGGDVGLDLAINHPGMVIRLAVSGATFRPSPLEPGAKATSDVIPKFIREHYERISPDGAGHWPVLFARVLHMWETQPNFTREQLAGIVAPTLVIAGDHDFCSPEYYAELWRAIPAAELWIAPNNNHGLPVRRAPLFDATVDAFFKEPSPAHP
jgi:pimeloyl-ACP methyl ester carboxylesterase